MAGATSDDNKTTGESGEGTRGSGTAAAAAKSENKEDPNKEKVIQPRRDRETEREKGAECLV